MLQATTMEPSDPLDSQWISIHIRDHLDGHDISIRDSLVSPGDFHSPDNYTQTLTESAIDKMTIPAHGLGEVCARGRRGSEGWLDLFDGEKKICELHWDNRVGVWANDFEVLDGDKDYVVECSGWSSSMGSPLGHVFVDVSRAQSKQQVKEKVQEIVEEARVRGEMGDQVKVQVKGVSKSGV